jgi:hypothetical protein
MIMTKHFPEDPWARLNSLATSMNDSALLVDPGWMPHWQINAWSVDNFVDLQL